MIPNIPIIVVSETTEKKQRDHQAPSVIPGYEIVAETPS